MVRNCGNCKYFGGNEGWCLAGIIRKTDICDYHEFSLKILNSLGAKKYVGNLNSQLNNVEEPKIIYQDTDSVRERREKND